MANQNLGFSPSTETVTIGKIAYKESYGNFSVNENKTSTGGNINTQKSFYRYPKAKLDNDDYLEIKIREYVAPKFNVKGPSNDKIDTLTFETSTEAAIRKKVATKYRIQLPIPSGIQDTNQVKWNEDSINAFEAIGIAEASKTLQSGNLLDGFVNSIKSTINAAEGFSVSGAQDLATAFFSTELIKMLGSNVSVQSVLTRSTGLALNPNMELLFQGPTLRSFTFSFDFTPRSKEESLEVKQIIRIFKQSMAPKKSIGGLNNNSLGSGVFIATPDIFELEYKHGSNTHPFLHKFQPCALTNMGVDYAASGPYATYNDATPVHMKLSLQFTELNPIYFEDYNNLTDLDNVGY